MSEHPRDDLTPPGPSTEPLGGATVTCVLGHPMHQTRGTLEGAKR